MIVYDKTVIRYDDGMPVASMVPSVSIKDQTSEDEIIPSFMDLTFCLYLLVF